MESDGFNDRVDIPRGSNLNMQKFKDQVGMPRCSTLFISKFSSLSPHK